MTKDDVIEVELTGIDLLSKPLLNKGTAFTESERDAFHLHGLLPPHVGTLEQQVNASDLAEDVKVKLQSYVSGCYGSLTSFNVLFADEADQFKGSGTDQEK